LVHGFSVSLFCGYIVIVGGREWYHHSSAQRCVMMDPEGLQKYIALNHKTIARMYIFDYFYMEINFGVFKK
jgi:hypothetical protein